MATGLRTATTRLVWPTIIALSPTSVSKHGEADDGLVMLRRYPASTGADESRAAGHWDAHVASVLMIAAFDRNMPCLMAFWLDLALPSSDLAP